MTAGMEYMADSRELRMKIFFGRAWIRDKIIAARLKG